MTDRDKRLVLVEIYLHGSIPFQWNRDVQAPEFPVLTVPEKTHVLFQSSPGTMPGEYYLHMRDKTKSVFDTSYDPLKPQYLSRPHISKSFKKKIKKMGTKFDSVFLSFMQNKFKASYEHPDFLPALKKGHEKYNTPFEPTKWEDQKKFKSRIINFENFVDRSYTVTRSEVKKGLKAFAIYFTVVSDVDNEEHHKTYNIMDPRDCLLVQATYDVGENEEYDAFIKMLHTTKEKYQTSLDQILKMASFLASDICIFEDACLGFEQVGQNKIEITQERHRLLKQTMEKFQRLHKIKTAGGARN